MFCSKFSLFTLKTKMSSYDIVGSFHGMLIPTKFLDLIVIIKNEPNRFALYTYLTCSRWEGWLLFFLIYNPRICKLIRWWSPLKPNPQSANCAFTKGFNVFSIADYPPIWVHVGSIVNNWSFTACVMCLFFCLQN